MPTTWLPPVKSCFLGVSNTRYYVYSYDGPFVIFHVAIETWVHSGKWWSILDLLYLKACQGDLLIRGTVEGNHQST